MYKDFIIDFKNKKIEYSKVASGKNYTVYELYSFLQDIFDEPENMKYDLPIEALSKLEFKLVNGWSIDEETRKYLKGKLL